MSNERVEPSTSSRRQELEQKLKELDSRYNTERCFWGADANLYGVDFANAYIEKTEKEIAEVKLELEALPV
jgi:hypothetical protein